MNRQISQPMLPPKPSADLQALANIHGIRNIGLDQLSATVQTRLTVEFDGRYAGITHITIVCRFYSDDMLKRLTDLCTALSLLEEK